MKITRTILVVLLLLGVALVSTSVEAGAATPSGKVANAPEIKKPKCTDTFTNAAGGYGFGTNGNWSKGVVPGPSDFACIPSSIKQTVIFASYEGSILGIKSKDKAGLALNNGGLTLTADPSSIEDIATGNAGLTVDAGVTLSLTGKTGNLGLGAFDLYGPGTVLIPKNDKLNMGNVQMLQGLQVINQGTITGAGAGACQDTAASPAELDNKALMDLTTSGSWGGGTFCTNNGGNFINDTTGTLDITGASTSVQMTAYATWDNLGSISIGTGDTLGLSSNVSFDGSVSDGGELKVQNNVNLSSSSVLGIDIKSATSYGYLDGASAVGLAGTLAISTGSFAPSVGQSFTIGYSGRVTGNFSGAFSSITTNGVSGVCLPADGPGVGFVLSFGTISFFYDMILTVESGVAGC
jgi:hypothetical protein